MGQRADSLSIFDSAIYYYSKALSLDSTDLIALTNRGRAFISKEDYKSGIADYDKTIQLYPSDGTYRRRGAIHLAMKNYSKARHDLLRSVEINPSTGETFYLLAVLELAENNLDMAMAYLKAADGLSYDPDFSFSIHARYFEAKQDFRSAIKYWEEYIRIDSLNDVPYNNLGYCKLQLKDYASALKDFDRSIVLNPKSAFAYNNKAFALLKLHQPVEASVFALKSYDLDSTNAHVFRTFAEIRIVDKKFKEGCVYLKKALSLSTDSLLKQEIILLLNRNCEVN